jgi:hypothetical protein
MKSNKLPNVIKCLELSFGVEGMEFSLVFSHPTEVVIIRFLKADVHGILKDAQILLFSGYTVDLMMMCSDRTKVSC